MREPTRVPLKSRETVRRSHGTIYGVENRARLANSPNMRQTTLIISPSSADFGLGSQGLSPLFLLALTDV